MTTLAARFKSPRRTLQAAPGGFLTEDQMRERLPAIFAAEAHDSRSDRYTYIPTIEILRALAAEGFKPTFAVQSTPRNDDRVGYTKHLLRLRRFDGNPNKAEVPEVIGVNSHGGESGFQLFGGIFRSICLNGMVCGETFEEVRVRHSGSTVDDVIEGTYRVVSRFDAILAEVEAMKGTKLSRDEQYSLAESVALLRLDAPTDTPLPIDPEDFNKARRPEDEGNDLWRTFNRLQENAVRGGLVGTMVTEDRRARQITTRPVEGIDGNLRLNREIWTRASRMAWLMAA